MNALLAQFSSFWLPAGQDLLRIGPDLALIGTLILVLAGTMVVGKRSHLSALMVLTGLIVAFILNAGVYKAVSGDPWAGLHPDGAAMLLADNFTVFFKAFLLVFLLAVTLLWMLGSAAEERNAPEFFILLIGSAIGMSLMVSTLNLLMIIIAIELASLPSYAIVAFDKRSRPGAEASMKYVIFGSISAAIMLYGASLLYGLFGTLDLTVMAPAILAGLSDPSASRPLLYFALFAFLAGVGFKISAVPFHFWCPDVFQGAKIEVTTWLSVASKAAGLCLLVRIMHVLGTASGSQTAPGLLSLTVAVGVFAAITCFVGNLAAYRQSSVKRLLAYSSIAHAGYMLMLAAIMMRPEPGHLTAEVWTALIFYICMYFFMNLGAFGATALVVWRTGSDEIENFNGLGRRSPGLALGMTLCLFSLIGMPPLGGFIAKWWLLTALAGQGQWLWFLIVWASLNTLFSLFYYMRIIKHMYLVDDGRPALRADARGVIIVNLCAVALVAAGTFLPGRIRSGVDDFARHLLTAPPQAVTARQSGEPAERSRISAADEGGPVPSPGAVVLDRAAAPETQP